MVYAMGKVYVVGIGGDYVSRMTQHSGRGTKYGLYNSHHNDRDFDVAEAPGIDVKRMRFNRYYGRTTEALRAVTDAAQFETLSPYNEQTKAIAPPGRLLPFHEQERMFYEQKFRKQYERQMEAYRKKGNTSRIVDFETWRQSRRYAPEEVVYQIGKIGDKPVSDAEAVKILERIFEFVATRPFQYNVLDGAIHVDEKDSSGNPGVPHLHIRRVWYYEDADGVTCIGQEKSLEQSKMPLPQPKVKAGKYNNRKMMFDKLVREAIAEKIQQEFGVTIETVPVQGAKHNRSKAEYLRDVGLDALKEAKAKEKAIEEREKRVSEREAAVAEREKELEAAAREIKDIKAREKALETIKARPLPDTSSIKAVDQTDKGKEL